jgi:hypothetical protein
MICSLIDYVLPFVQVYMPNTKMPSILLLPYVFYCFFLYSVEKIDVNKLKTGFNRKIAAQAG